LSEQVLFTLIASPLGASSPSLNVKVSDDDILKCIEAGAPLGLVDHIQCGLNLSQEFAIAKIKFLDSRIHFSEILIGSAPGNNSPADSESFQAWLGSKLQKHVVCRVEGTDDVLFVDALLDQSTCVLRSNAAGIWNNFSYKHKVSDKQVEMKMRVKTLSPEQLKQERTGVLERAINDCIEDLDVSIRRLIPEANFSWVNIVDSDLEAPVQLRPSSSILNHRLRWGRAIENILLPISAPAAALVRQPEKTHQLFLEVFERISLNFFAPSCSTTASIGGISKAHVQTAGVGWLGLHNVTVKDSKDSKLHAQIAPVKQFIETIISSLCSSRPGIAPDMLLLYELFREVISLEASESQSGTRDELIQIFARFDRVTSALPQGEGTAAGPPSDPLGTFIRYISAARSESSSLLQSGGATTPLKLEFLKRHNSESFWFPFPRFILFLTNLCCMKDVPQQIETMSRMCISAIFQVICAVLFDLPDGTNLSASILSATGCPGYLPCNVGTKKQCLLCQQPPAEHKLRHACKKIEDLKALPEDFLKLFCRVGSIGWDSHDFMVLVHGRQHLGRAFAREHIVESQLLYRQHLQLHVFASETTTPVACTECPECLAMSVPDSLLPPKVLDDISALQLLRQRELGTLVGHMDAIFNGDALKSSTPLTSVEVLSPRNGNKAGGGGAKAVGKNFPPAKNLNQHQLLPSNPPAPPAGGAAAAVENDSQPVKKEGSCVPAHEGGGVRQRPKHGDSAKKESGGDGARPSRSAKKDGSDDPSPQIHDVPAKAAWGGGGNITEPHGSDKEQRSPVLNRRTTIGVAAATVLLLAISFFFFFGGHEHTPK
jgi:hypothetical protein